MSRKTKRTDKNGFEDWGGYMNAKKAKLLDQFKETTSNFTNIVSSIFKGVAIFVNGYTNPTAEELKSLMAAHGGSYHQYESSHTTHIIASNLPNVKIKQMGNTPIVKAAWITDSIAANNLLDYRKYLLYTKKDRKQPNLNFPVVNEVKSHKTLTAADPQFLTEFYNNSRLHLISTLVTEFKRLVSQLRDNSSGIFPGRTKLKLLSSNESKSNESVIMHIDMDCFFVSVGIRQRPDLKGQPVAVTHAKSSQGSVNRSESNLNEEFTALQKYFPGEYPEKLDVNASMSEIASCSYEARKFGVRNGMFLGSALKLCPDLKTIPYDFLGYREVSTALYKTIADYTLDIEAVSCDEMYVDITSVLSDTGISIEQWATHIRNEIMEITGCPCSTGFGANRLQARLATKKAKPAGQFHLKSEDVDEFMAEIPLADLPGVGYATVTKLSALGLKTCGDLQATSLPILQSEIGHKAGETIFQQSRGIDHKPLNFEHERKSISADVNYGIRFKTKIEALNFIRSLSEEVNSRLQETGMRARCLTLKLLVRTPEAPKETPKFLGCGVCNGINRSTTTGSLISDTAMIFKEAKALYERANVSPDELRGVGIQLTRLEKVAPINPVLSNFLQTSDKDKELKPDFVQCVTVEVKKQTSTTGLAENKKQTKCIRSKSTKTTNTLNKYFNLPSNSKSTHLLDVDFNVLNELPENLRKEIIKEYGLDSIKVPPVKAPASIVKRLKAPVEQKSPFDGLDWEELKLVIISWLKTESQPADIDVTLIAQYLKQLALDRKIEDLKKMINFLYRHISKTDMCIWHEVYYKIINTVQEGMISRYGSTLLVERKFLCNIHC